MTENQMITKQAINKLSFIDSLTELQKIEMEIMILQIRYDEFERTMKNYNNKLDESYKKIFKNNPVLN